MAQKEHKEVNVRDSGGASAIAASARHVHNQRRIAHTHTHGTRASDLSHLAEEPEGAPD